MYKILHNLAPNYLFSLLPENPNVRYMLGKASQQCTFSTKTNVFYNSYFLSTLRIWNDLPESLKNDISLDIFFKRPLF